MARRITLILLVGLVLIWSASLLVFGLYLYHDEIEEFDGFGRQNATIGARATERIMAKAIANGIFDTETLFAQQYQPIEGSEGLRFHTGYDRYLDRNLPALQDAFLAAPEVYYAYVVSMDGYVPVHSDNGYEKTKVHPVDPGIHTRQQDSGRQQTGDGHGFEYFEYCHPIMVGNRQWGEFRIGIPKALLWNEFQQGLLGAALMGTLGGLLLAATIYITLRRGLRPLAELAETTSRMASGDLTARVRVEGHDELGALATSFNAMADEVQQSHESLERRVSERTKELLTIFEESPTALIVVDSETRRIIRANDHALQMGQRSHEEVVGKICKRFLCPTKSHGCRVLDNGEDIKAAKQFVERPDGTLIPVLRTITPITLDDRPCLLESFTDISALAEAEDKLEEQHNILANVLSNIPYFVFWKDRESKYLGCNRQFLESIGFHEIGQLVGKSDFDMPWTRAEAEWYRECDRRVMDSGEALLNVEESQRQADGSVCTLLTSKVPLRNQADEVIGILGIYADISELKRKEAVIQTSEALHRAITESAKDAIVAVDAGNAIRFWNPAAEEIFGYSTEEAVGMSIASLLVPDAGDESGDAEDRTSEGRGTYLAAGKTLELTGRHKDGRRFPVEVSASSDDGDHASITVALIRDITERKLAQMELHLQSTALASAANAILITNADQRIILTNPAFTHLTGYGDEEVRGRDPRSLSGEIEADSLEEDPWSIARTGQVWSGEVTSLHKDGTEYVEEMTITPVRCERDEICHYIAIKQDVTQRKKTQEELEIQRCQESVTNALLRISLDDQPFESQLWDALDEILSVPWLPLSQKGGIFLLNEAEGRLELRVHRNLDPAIQASCAHVSVGYCLCGRAAETGRIVFSSAVDERHDIAYRGMINHGHYCVPINSGDRNLGVVVLYLAAGHIENKLHTNFLKSVAQILAAMLERNEAKVRLATAQKELVNASHQAGMAEVASSVLHNVGNVLNSVNVSASLVSERVKKSRISGVSRLASLVNDHKDDLDVFFTQDEKGRKIPGYLASLADALSEEQEDVLKEIGLLEKNIDHIKKVVMTQQDYAKLSGMRQEFNIADILRDALRLCQSSIASHGIYVIEEIDDVPDIVGDPQKTLQIFINVISNAAHALHASEREDKQITARLKAYDDGFLRAEIEDNGQGISPEALPKLFRYGYTTKKSGHGFGLHHGVLAAKEMGGSLEAHSDGVGKGARFTLSLPANAERKKV